MYSTSTSTTITESSVKLSTRQGKPMARKHQQKRASSIHNLFPDLPPYLPPKTGLVGSLPRSLVPYAELMRLHKPAGYYAFLFPHVFGTLYAAAAISPSAPSIRDVAFALVIHALSCLVLRGWACTYNDALDAPFDRLVARCRHRPVARGAVSAAAAHGFAAAQVLAWVALLILLPKECYWPSFLFAVTMAVYPLCKRITNFPQVVLGFSFAFGQSIGIASLGINPFGDLPTTIRGTMLCLYLSNVMNTIVYDTIYAYQDIEYDIKAGVMSLAILIRGHSKLILTIASILEVILLVGAGYLGNFGSAYYVLAVVGTVAVLTHEMIMTDLNKPSDCWRSFQWLLWFTGATISGGLLGEYLDRL